MVSFLAYAQIGYINLKYKPSKTDIVAEFFIEPRNIGFDFAAEHVAAESSIGTWTDIGLLSKEIAEKLRPSVFYLDERTGIAKIAYPIDLFEAGNIPQLLSSIAGNVFGMKALKNLRLLDIHLPEKMIKSFKGPMYGIPGIRKLLNVKKRPLVGTIIKPKLGLTEAEHARVAFNAWFGGCDIVKDDENLTSMVFNKFEKRLDETLKQREKAQKETGEKKIYMPNITAETNEMLRRAKLAHDAGNEYVMVDLLTVGFSALQTLRNENDKLKLVLHGHRAMHAALTRNPKHGISMLVIAKLARLIGLDQLHIGALVGKMEGGEMETKHIGEEIESSVIGEEKRSHVLAQKWFDLKPVFAVCSGGLHPGLTPVLVRTLGNDIIIQMGGGIHGHPKGTIDGARAARQAVEATMQGISLKDYAETNPELKFALLKWGTRPTG